jgi:transmembrane sensor
MSQVVAININKDPLDEASVWIAKLDKGLSDTEVAELKGWLKLSHKHVESFIKLAEFWDKMESLSQLSELFPHKPQPSFNKKRPVLAWAASVMIASLLSLGLWFKSDVWWTGSATQVVQFNHDYVTQVGEQANFVLLDNTKLVLNTNSSVTVTYTDTQRVVELLRGEMHVTVAHNKHKPLSVYAGSNIMQAAGTAFNVQLDHDKVELIVTDGKVLVADITSLPTAPLELKNVYLSKESFTVSKGQKAQLKASDTIIIGSNEGKLASDLAWQQGNIIFRGESLGEAMQEISRYTNYQFDFSDEDIKRLKIAGRFKTSDINNLLMSLESNFAVAYERTSQNRIRLSKKPSSD